MAKQPGEIPVESNIDTVLAEDVLFKGTLKFDTLLKIKGRLEGEIQAKNGHLVVGDSAEVKANISAAVVSNVGKIIGNVAAEDTIEIFKSASIKGNISTKNLVIIRGGYFSGQCDMNIYS